MIRAISDNMAFTSRYSLDVNQKMESPEACAYRDYMLGVFAAQANNGNEVIKKSKDFFEGEYKTNPNAPCPVEIDLPDYLNTGFEQAMKEAGVNFDKIA